MLNTWLIGEAKLDTTAYIAGLMPERFCKIRIRTDVRNDVAMHFSNRLFNVPAQWSAIPENPTDQQCWKLSA